MKYLKLFAALCCVAAVFAACEKNNIKQISVSGTANGHDYVDLGLPSGLKWATCNVGAAKPEEYGNYYSWGETDPDTTYNWSTYKLATTTTTKVDSLYDMVIVATFTKYNTHSRYGIVDDKITLDAEDDAANVNWGGKWRMPTDADWTELHENCTWTWTALNGVKGYIVTSQTNDNSMFIPAAGYRYNDDLYNAGYDGCYWSAALDTLPVYASVMGFTSDIVSEYYYDRYFGLSVRGVCE
ncbi:MAG: hypothetical protein ACI30H_09170 [Paludibacteraceae bacterium]